MRTFILLGILSVAGCATSPPPSQAPARNVILFIGDGMGIATVTAARILAGQQHRAPGEANVLSFETFPNVALSKTYNTDMQVPDSAGTMSAIMTGEKTRAGVISVAAAPARGDCAASLDAALPTFLEQAERAGWATGIVSTARITHATPAATYAHSPERNWEADSAMPAAAREAGCRDIAMQLVEFDQGDGIEVVYGGGRAAFLPVGTADPEYPEVEGVREDGRDLIAEWQRMHPEGHWLWSTSGFEALPPAAVPVLGLFQPSHMQFSTDRAEDRAGEPTLAALTADAIRRLEATGRGFFLMVEAGRIDHGHHAGNAYRALTDTIAYAEAVRTADELTDPAETLIIVTADHGHAFTISGYPPRGNPIFGLANDPGPDDIGYTTLGYANGPGYVPPNDDGEVPGLEGVDTTDPDYLQRATVPLPSNTHGGADVAVYARGPGARGVHGVMEQNTIHDVMWHAVRGFAQ